MILQEITLTNETKQNDLMLLSNCVVCGKKNQFSLSLLEIKNSTILIIFQMISWKSKKSLNGDKFMSELHLKQPRIYL